MIALLVVGGVLVGLFAGAYLAAIGIIKLFSQK